MIYGHTDSVGSSSSNQTLSERRAQAVAEVAKSVGANVFLTSGQGEHMPKATNSTSEGRALNRRVELVCLYAPRSQ